MLQLQLALFLVPSSPSLVTLMKEALSYSETSALTAILHSHRMKTSNLT
jgi:hypothetical protein